MINTKCHKCNKWTNREGNADDVCEHCGHLIEEDRINYKLKKDEIKKQSEAESLLLIREEDSERKKKLKKAATWARVIFLVLLFAISAIVFASHG